MNGNILCHIGLPKTGTTSFHSELMRDDRLYILYKDKFICSNAFFSKNDWSFGDLTTVIADETICRNINGQNRLGKTLSRLSQIAPNSKILITIREQKSLLLSRYKHALKINMYHNDFVSWIKDDKWVDYIDIIDFNMIYSICNAFFPNNQIKVLTYEELALNYTGFIKEFYTFLELSTPEKLHFYHRNESLKKKELSVQLRFNRMFPFLSSFDYSFRKKCFSLWKRMFSQTLKNTNTIYWDNSNSYLRDIENEIRLSNHLIISKIPYIKPVMVQYSYLL